jgi:hypothetical protein
MAKEITIDSIIKCLEGARNVPIDGPYVAIMKTIDEELAKPAEPNIAYDAIREGIVRFRLHVDNVLQGQKGKSAAWSGEVQRLIDVLQAARHNTAKNSPANANARNVPHTTAKNSPANANARNVPHTTAKNSPANAKDYSMLLRKAKDKVVIDESIFPVVDSTLACFEKLLLQKSPPPAVIANLLTHLRVYCESELYAKLNGAQSKSYLNLALSLIARFVSRLYAAVSHGTALFRRFLKEPDFVQTEYQKELQKVLESVNSEVENVNNTTRTQNQQNTRTRAQTQQANTPRTQNQQNTPRQAQQPQQGGTMTPVQYYAAQTSLGVVSAVCASVALSVIGGGLVMTLPVLLALGVPFAFGSAIAVAQMYNNYQKYHETGRPEWDYRSWLATIVGGGLGRAASRAKASRARK